MFSIKYFCCFLKLLWLCFPIVVKFLLVSLVKKNYYLFIKPGLSALNLFCVSPSSMKCLVLFVFSFVLQTCG